MQHNYWINRRVITRELSLINVLNWALKLDLFARFGSLLKSVWTLSEPVDLSSVIVLERGYRIRPLLELATDKIVK